MKIAQIAPPWISIPPANYGGTETIIGFIVEELVAQGHDVTLFASGDSKTPAKLVSHFPNALLSEGVPWQAHLKSYFHLAKSLEQAGEFDVVHTHLSHQHELRSTRVLAAVLPRMVEKRFAWDLELFVVARHLGYDRFLEAPIRLTHKFSSTISAKAVWMTLLDTAAIWYRLHVLRWYDRVPS